MTDSNAPRSREYLDSAAVVGYDIEALDGSLGTVDAASDDFGPSFIAVRTERPHLGRKVLLPVLVVERVSHEESTIFVARTIDEIKNAPEYDEGDNGQAYLLKLARYYGPGGPAYREQRSP